MAEAAEPTPRSRNLAALLLSQVSIPVLAIFTALVVSSLVMLVSGTDPIKAYQALGEGAFGTRVAVIETLIKATPFILAGLGIALAFRGGLFNIGMEGQLFVGSVCAVVIGYSFELPTGIHLIVALVGAAVGGALWAAIPGYLK